MTGKSALPAGWYHGWNIVAVCVLAQTVGNGIPVSGFSLFLHDWTVQFHTPISTLLLGLMSCSIGSAVASPFIGVFADRYSARWLFGIGLALMALFCLGISFAAQTWQFVSLYGLLFPVALCLTTTVPANAVVSRWFARRLGLALGLTAFGLGLAGIVAPPVIAAILPTLGWRAIWRIAGIVTGVVILPLVVFVLRDRPDAREAAHDRVPNGAAPARHAHAPSSTGGGLRLRDVLTRRNFWLLVIAYMPMLAIYGGCMQNLVPIATSRGFSTHAAGVLLSAFSVAQLAASFGGGVLSDRFGNRLPLAGLAFATALGGVIVAYGHGLAAFGLGSMLAGLGGGFWPLLAAAIAAEFGAANAGRALGLAVFFLPVAALAPFVVAKMQESSGNYVPTLLVMAGLNVVGCVACLLMRERRARLGPQAGGAGHEAALPIG